MKTVAYACPFVPGELIAAHGLHPRRILPASPRGAGETMEGLCPFARAAVEFFSQGRDDAFVFTTVCDQMRRAAEWFAGRDGRPTFLMNVPATWQTPAAAGLYLDELRRLGRFLVGLGGREAGDAELAGAILEYEAARAALRERRGQVPARRFAEAVAEFPSPGGRADGRPEPGAGTPVAVAGGPLLREHLAALDLVERFGGRVVLLATANGEMTLPAPMDRRRVADRPLETLAGAYFGSIPHAMRRPDSLLHQFLHRELAARGARGVLFQRYLWCDTWHAELARLRESTSLPILDMEIGDDDAAYGRLAGRIQAFLEVVR